MTEINQTRNKMDIEPTAGGSGASPKGRPIGDGTRQESKEGEQGNNRDVCALFATSAPRDIWANPSLAAIAALIDEDEDQKKESDKAEPGNHPSDRAAARSDPPAVSSGTAPKSDPAGALRSTTSDNENSSTGSSSSDGDGGGGGGVTSGLRHHRREDTRRRRNERRATPYGGVGAVGGGRRGRGVAPSSAVGTRSRRAGPTTGETQVMMSLWGL
ncbi:unnamed protein product [Pylaiella littoralis]